MFLGARDGFEITLSSHGKTPILVCNKAFQFLGQRMTLFRGARTITPSFEPQHQPIIAVERQFLSLVMQRVAAAEGSAPRPKPQSEGY
jgi:hypothetical protein